MSRADGTRTINDNGMVYPYPTASGRPNNPAPIGFCAFSLTLFVYSMYMAGATVPITASPSIAMGLALFYGGLIELLAGLYELRIGSNFYALLFCSYAGYWFGLGSLYVTGSFQFTTPFLTDLTAFNNTMGVFYLSWTIFTLGMLISSVRTHIPLVIFFFTLLLTYVLFTASYFLNGQYDLRRAGGAFGIVTSVVGWYIGFASLLIRGDNAYFALPLPDISRRSTANAGQAVEVRPQK